MERPLFIGLAGPSGAGKTTLVKHITEHYPHITHIRLDGFFKSYDTFPRYGSWVNRETPENIEWDNFFDALLSLQQGKPTVFPVYEKITGVQCGSELVTPKSVVLVEGYLLYYDPRIRNLFDKKLYMHVSVPEQYTRKKARWPEMDDAYFYEVVVPMFEMHGSHGARFADAILNGDQSQNDLLQEFISSPHIQPLLEVTHYA